MSVTLNIDACSNYEPTETEIKDYAEWLGMNLPDDGPFLWIAREGLKAPLPENWKACQSDKGELYYFNLKTGESIWDHPLDNYFKTLFINEKKNPTSRSISRCLKPEHDQVQTTARSRSKRRVVEIFREAGQKKNIGSEYDSNTREINCSKLKNDLPSTPTIISDVPAEKTDLTSSHEAQKYQNAKHCNSPNRTFSGTQDKTGPTAQAISMVDINSQKEVKKIPKKSRTDKIVLGLVEKVLNKSIEKNDRKLDLSEVAMRDMNSNVPLNATDLQKEKETLQSDQEGNFQELQEPFDGQSPKSLPAPEKKSDRTLKEDQHKMGLATVSSQDQLQGKSSIQRSMELIETGESIRDQLSPEMKNDGDKTKRLELLTSEMDAKREFKWQTHVSEVREFQTALSNELRECASTLLKDYEKAYTLLYKEVIKSKNDFASRVAQQEADTKRALDFELTNLKQNNDCLIREETERACKKMQEIRQQHHRDINALNESNYAELKKMIHDSIRGANAKGAVRKTSVPVAKDFSSKASQLALDAFYTELGDGYETKLKSADSVLEDQQEILVELKKPSVNDIALKSNYASSQGQTNDLSRRGKCHNTHNICSIDGNLDCATSQEADSYGLLPYSKPYNVKDIIREALKEVFTESPPILSDQSVNNAKYPSIDLPRPIHSSSPSIINDVKAPRLKNSTFPASFKDHHELIGAERRRVREGWMFVKNQRKNLEERRQQLKHTRHQWKKDVFDAKRDGVKSTSKRGRLLFQVRMALEEQAQGLQHDECILHDSELWLLSKEQRLENIEHQIKDHEMHQSIGENSSMDCSLDTAGLVTDFFEPQCNFESVPLRPNPRSYLCSVSMFERGVTSPMLVKSLKQIEKHLGEATSILKMQKTCENLSAPLLNCRNCFTPTYSASRDSKKCRYSFETCTKEAKPKQLIRSGPL